MKACPVNSVYVVCWQINIDLMIWRDHALSMFNQWVNVEQSINLYLHQVIKPIGLYKSKIKLQTYKSHSIRRLSSPYCCRRLRNTDLISCWCECQRGKTVSAELINLPDCLYTIIDIISKQRNAAMQWWRTLYGQVTSLCSHRVSKLQVDLSLHRLPRIKWLCHDYNNHSPCSLAKLRRSAIRYDIR